MPSKLPFFEIQLKISEFSLISPLLSLFLLSKEGLVKVNWANTREIIERTVIKLGYEIPNSAQIRSVFSSYNSMSW